MKWLTDPDVPEYVTRVVPPLMGAAAAGPRLVHAHVIVAIDGDLCVGGGPGGPRVWLRPDTEGVTWIHGKHTEKSQAGRALLATYMLTT
jgi:hypothetical protein